MSARDELEQAARALVAKLDECDRHITNAFMMETVRGRPYSGPQYGEELKALRAALTHTEQRGE